MAEHQEKGTPHKACLHRGDKEQDLPVPRTITDHHAAVDGCP